MPNSWPEVIAWAHANPTDYGRDWDGRCESFVQDAGAFGTGFPTAHAAYLASHVYTPDRLSIDAVPTGWCLWWDFVAADGTNYGHVAFAAPTGDALMASGYVTTPVHTHLGYIGRRAYGTRTGHRYLGASPDHGGRTLAGVIRSVPAAGRRTVLVKDGDTLRSLAARYRTTWQELYRLNRGVIGADPDRIKPGVRLVTP